MSDKPQVWDVPISNEERLSLFEIAFLKDQTVETAADGKKFRRMVRAFGLATIRDAVRKNQGAVPMVAVNGDRRLFKITAENVDHALDYQKTKRNVGTEMVLGELFDRLEVVQANGVEPADDERRAAWLQVPVFSADEDAKLWDKKAEEDPTGLTCPSCGQDIALDEARQAHAKAHPEPTPAADS